ncbi:MAG: hypothetical protein ABSB35_01445 [Bryobacteraceae bacterium]
MPYNLIHDLVEVRSTPTTIEITIAEHRPRSHPAHLEWTPSRMVHWAQTIGPHTARLFERVLADKPHPETGYRYCLSSIRLADQYSPARMEASGKPRHFMERLVPQGRLVTADFAESGDAEQDAPQHLHGPKSGIHGGAWLVHCFAIHL